MAQRTNFLSLCGIALSMTTLLLATNGCSKGTNTARRSQWWPGDLPPTTELHNPYPANKSIGPNLVFNVKTKNGEPLPSVAVEFKAFLITDAITAGLDEESIKEGIKDGWSGLDFIMQADGTLKGRHCSAGEYRHDCVGQLFGGSAYTNQFGQTSVGFITPNMPGARIAIAMRTPERSLASNKIQYLQLNVMTNEEFANSNLEPLDASFSIIPFLVNRDGQNVIKAGTTFSLLLSIPEIPNTEVGKGFSFYVETKNVGDEVDGVDVIVPGGVDGADLSCEFLNGFCIVPGGPFKVLKPTTLTISARPTSSSFPVKPTSLEIGVIDSDTLKQKFMFYVAS